MLKQYSPSPRAQLDGWEGRYAVRPVGARVARSQIYAGLGRKIQSALARFGFCHEAIFVCKFTIIIHHFRPWLVCFVFKIMFIDE